MWPQAIRRTRSALDGFCPARTTPAAGKGEATRSPGLTFRRSSHGSASSPWCSWPLASRAASSRGSLRRVPRAGLSGVRTWRRAAAPGRRQEAAAKPSRPRWPAPPATVSRSRCFPCRQAARRYPWHLRALTSHRPRPPYGRRRAKPALETVEKLVTGSGLRSPVSRLRLMVDTVLHLCLTPPARACPVVTLFALNPLRLRCPLAAVPGQAGKLERIASVGIKGLPVRRLAWSSYSWLRSTMQNRLPSGSSSTMKSGSWGTPVDPPGAERYEPGRLRLLLADVGDMQVKMRRGRAAEVFG